MSNLLYHPDHKMTVRSAVGTLAMTSAAQGAIDFAHAYACLRDDHDAFIHTLGPTAFTAGDDGIAGTNVVQGHARVAILRYNVGSSDACWLWNLEQFIYDPIGSILRVRDWYDSRDYPRSSTEDY